MNFILLQINAFQQTIIFNRRLYHLRLRFQRNELLSLLAKSHRRQQNMWTRLPRRWQIKRHTLKVSDLYQSLSLLTTHSSSFASRSHATERRCITSRWKKNKNETFFKAILKFIYYYSSKCVSLFVIAKSEVPMSKCWFFFGAEELMVTLFGSNVKPLFGLDHFSSLPRIFKSTIPISRYCESFQNQRYGN